MLYSSFDNKLPFNYISHLNSNTNSKFKFSVEISKRILNGERLTKIKIIIINSRSLPLPAPLPSTKEINVIVVFIEARKTSGGPTNGFCKTFLLKLILFTVVRDPFSKFKIASSVARG